MTTFSFLEIWWDHSSILRKFEGSPLRLNGEASPLIIKKMKMYQKSNTATQQPRNML
jgi:hypothetical protein